eukprot:364416-Chlamydomonas_euryale.AAC.24
MHTSSASWLDAATLDSRESRAMSPYRQGHAAQCFTHSRRALCLDLTSTPPQMSHTRSLVNALQCHACPTPRRLARMLHAGIRDGAEW